MARLNIIWVSFHEARVEALDEVHWSNTRIPGTRTSGVSENSDRFGGVTVASKAAGRSAIQEGSKSLTGLNRSPGMIFRCSLMATKEAAVAKLKIVCLSLSRRKIRPPLPPQATTWSPKVSRRTRLALTSRRKHREAKAVWRQLGIQLERVQAETINRDSCKSSTAVGQRERLNLG